MFCRVDLDSEEVCRVSEEGDGVFSLMSATDLRLVEDCFITI